jgi:hypothetical protein
MKIVASIAFPSAPSTEHLAGVAFAAGATHLVLSLPHDVPTPEMAGLNIERTSHFNVPWEMKGMARIRRYQNTIAAPLANFVMGFLDEDDIVLSLHDNVGGQSAFEKIITKASLHPHFGFVSVAPRTRPAQPGYVDYGGRCLTWRPVALSLYAGQSIPEDSAFIGTSMEWIMSLMDADSAPYIWTKIACIENYTPPPPPSTP